jgi:hypothetical protein
LLGGEYGSSEPRTKSRRPPPLYIEQGDGGPPAMDGLGAPDQGAWIKGPTVEINLTFFLLISTYTLTLNFDFNSFHFYLFHHILALRACFIVVIIANKFDSYNARLCSETDSLTLDPFNCPEII